MKKNLLFSVVVLFLIFQGCSTYRYTCFPTMTIAGPEIQNANFRVNDYQLADKEVQGEDIMPIVIFFPIIGDNQKLYMGMMDNAIQKICKEKNYAFLTNVRVYVSSWYIPLIYGQYKFVIRGEGWTNSQRSELMDELRNEGYHVAQVMD